MDKKRETIDVIANTVLTMYIIYVIVGVVIFIAFGIGVYFIFKNFNKEANKPFPPPGHSTTPHGINTFTGQSENNTNVLDHGFHDKFMNNNPLLGWRHWYLKNKTKNLVVPTDNFEGIVTRNYLDTLDNTQPWFSDKYSNVMMGC